MRQQSKAIGTVALMGGIPTIPTPFLWAWTQMLQFNAENMGPIHYMRTTTSFHATARNQIVDQMKGDWVLMLDTDNEFAPDLLYRMLKRVEQHDIDVLTGLYQFKSYPYGPVLYNWDQNGVPNKITGFQAQPTDQFNYFPVDVAGAGALFVKLSVFERILSELKENPFDIIPPLGEDFSFFKRLQKLGIKAWCDPALHVGHLSYRAVTLNDFDKSAYGAR